MAIWAWYGQLCLGRLYDAAEFLDVGSYNNLMSWSEKIDAREAVKRGRMVNRVSGELSSQLHERHHSTDFDLRTEDKLSQ
jgi:GST-like protein